MLLYLYILRRERDAVAEQRTHELLELVRAATSAEGMTWLERALADIAAGDAEIAQLFPATARKLGRGSLGAPASAQPYGASLAAWHTDDAGRALLLAAAKEAVGSAFPQVALDLYTHGDARERVGVLRALTLFTGEPALLPIVLDAVRTNQGSLFEATLCDNPYTSTHLPDLEFRKAVLKAVFVGLSIRRVVNLHQRANAELARSLVDYINEREAASRSVPAELWPFVALHPPEGAAAKIIGYLEHPSVDHRIACAEALASIVVGGDATALAFLRSRARRETDPAVRDALSSALARCEA